MLKNWLATPLQRAAWMSITCILLLVGMRLAMGTVWQGRLAGLLPAGIATLLFLRLFQRWRTSRRIVARRGMRVVKSWRSFAKSDPILEPLHMLSFAFVLISISLIMSGWHTEGRIFLDAGVVVLAIAGIWDIAVRATAIMRRAWAPAVGKVLSLSLGVALSAVTLSLAKQTTHSLVNIDPKYLIEFTAAIAGCLLPVVFVMAVAVALSLYACFQLMLLFVLGVGGMFVTHAKPFVSSEIQGRIRLFWYRIRRGKRPAAGVLTGASIFSPTEISLVASPLSKLAVVAMLGTVLQAATDVLPMASPALSKILVAMEYRTSASCKNISADVPVLYMDNGKASVARLQSGGYSFAVEACD